MRRTSATSNPARPSRSQSTAAPKTFRGVVAPDQPRLNASMTQNVVTYTVVVNTDNSDGLLIPYRTADLKFEVAQHPNVLMVPNTALRWKPSPERLVASGLPAEPVEQGRAAAKLQEIEPDGTTSGEGTVWIVDGERVRPVKVRTGLSDGTRTEVASNELQKGTTLAIGEEFVASDEVTHGPILAQYVSRRHSSAAAMSPTCR